MAVLFPFVVSLNSWDQFGGIGTPLGLFAGEPVAHSLACASGLYPDPRSNPRAQNLRSRDGSAAFLVETCRQLGDELVKAWHVHDCLPKIPPDEDEVLHARRLIAQPCLYGVDRNPMAVDLAKLSLWLATLAKDHGGGTLLKQSD